MQENLSQFEVEVLENLADFPQFKTELTEYNTPASIIEIREKIEQASGVIFSTPEYIFSIPSGLKNLLEWCVSTTVFSDKIIAIITASAQGEKGHDELQLIMRTLGATFDDSLTTLIQGVKGKIENGKIEDITRQSIEEVIENLIVEIKN